LVTRVPTQKVGVDVMIIFVLTFAIVALLALTLTGSIASGTQRRQ
jgi:hypothetical protein